MVTNLGEGPFSILSELADCLRQNPNTKIVLVGHSDAVGGLEEYRHFEATHEELRQRLISKYGIQKSRITAEGIAYLSPRASNQTPEGREQNRRVEAVVLHKSPVIWPPQYKGLCQIINKCTHLWLRKFPKTT